MFKVLLKAYRCWDISVRIWKGPLQHLHEDENDHFFEAFKLLLKTIILASVIGPSYA